MTYQEQQSVVRKNNKSPNKILLTLAMTLSDLAATSARTAECDAIEASANNHNEITNDMTQNP